MYTELNLNSEIIFRMKQSFKRLLGVFSDNKIWHVQAVKKKTCQKFYGPFKLWMTQLWTTHHLQSMVHRIAQDLF